MSTSKRVRQSALTSNDDLAEATSAFIESLLAPTSSISQTREKQVNSLHSKRKSAGNQLQTEREAISALSESVNQIPIDSDTTQKNNADDWVCPVAVALRRAGYDVPLRPSKSWLEQGY
ncbi:unnamed protein product [Adineta ricciae]|uniref:Uncharacterized protein n=1 Tax=Adineta ricciae TaxID=249248 RepID=A0A814WKT8_ADIRI|nr:unnamed protein product [Adineta ricciae]CAF1203711.1 unnamed protein product [Adineta ricciae]